MREILFRGKRIDGECWAFGYYWLDNTSGKHKITENLSDDNFVCHEVDSETVGQFTGYMDGDKKKVFEGDIALSNLYEDGFEVGSIVGKILYKGIWGCYIFEHENGWDNLDVVDKVIGNIHDNPELLNA